MFSTKKRFLIIWGVLGLLLLGGTLGIHLNGKELVEKGRWVDGEAALAELVDAGHTGPVRVNDSLVCTKPIVVDGKDYARFESWREENHASTINDREEWKRRHVTSDEDEKCATYTFVGRTFAESDLELDEPLQECKENNWQYRTCTKTWPATRDAQFEFDLKKGKWSTPLEQTHGTKESTASLYAQPVIPGVTMALWAIVGGVLWWRKRDDWATA